MARQARTRERNRIARDLHAPLGHRLPLISLYAGTLNSATGAQWGENVALLRSTAGDAMADLRQILGVLRQEEAGDEVGVAQPLGNLTPWSTRRGPPTATPLVDDRPPHWARPLTALASGTGQRVTS
ncbi:histidine kinase [Micromonospora peucetia]|uniref:histidine kinase n=1 Tax=Micromonospora peucetia TaxID=47871 RepID=UPI00398CE87D